MYLINEQKKKTRMGGKWLCRVFLVSTTPLDEPLFVDITKEISQKLGKEKQFDGINLTIYYWSGTGFMVIDQYLREVFWRDVEVIDISIF